MTGCGQRGRLPALLCALTLGTSGLPGSAAAGWQDVDLDARAKWFGTVSMLPEEDLQRQVSGTPSYDGNLDLRLMASAGNGGLRWQAALATTLVRGDALTLSAFGPPLDQTALDDGRRALDLAWQVDEGDRHRLVQRFDRLSLQYRRGPWSVTAGRDAVSWGNGLVFQPMDLFNPFAPTTVDQDYKTGDDLLLVERALADGGSVQAMAVARRDDDGDLTSAAGSFGGKWHQFLGASELELVAARHYADDVFAFAARLPLGGAMLRSDWVATRLDEAADPAAGDWEVSGVVNVDYSLLAGPRNVYLFAEYFHNGFGVKRLPDQPADYPLALTERLRRGELFNLMRDYLAVGGTVEWHPLWTQALTVIGNLHDGSTLLQTQIGHDPGDHQRIELGVVAPLGSAGEEFGGVPAGLVTTDGRAATVGGGIRVYLRWAYFF